MTRLTAERLSDLRRLAMDICDDPCAACEAERSKAGAP